MRTLLHTVRLTAGIVINQQRFSLFDIHHDLPETFISLQRVFLNAARVVELVKILSSFASVFLSSGALNSPWSLMMSILYYIQIFYKLTINRKMKQQINI